MAAEMPEEVCIGSLQDGNGFEIPFFLLYFSFCTQAGFQALLRFFMPPAAARNGAWMSEDQKAEAGWLKGRKPT